MWPAIKKSFGGEESIVLQIIGDVVVIKFGESWNH